MKALMIMSNIRLCGGGVVPYCLTVPNKIRWHWCNRVSAMMKGHPFYLPGTVMGCWRHHVLRV